MLCDMCGSGGTLYKASVEGAKLNLCDDCSKFGNVIGKVKVEFNDEKNIKNRKEYKKEFIESISSDYTNKIRNKREELKLTQKEFAKKINEKESLIQKIESGNIEPSIVIVNKIEKFLKINLLEKCEEETIRTNQTRTESLTIGDFIKIKKK